MAVIEDKYGRRFRTLRVSLVNHCNLGCTYCVTGEPGADVPRTSLEWPRLVAMIGRLHGQLHLQTIRLTGGEPLLYNDLVSLVAGIRAMGIRDIRLTTNGFLLERMAEPLAAAGIRKVNVSLDAIDETIFLRMTRRRSAARICAGIDAAVAAGLDVKINAVIMRGHNESEILPLMEFAFARGLRIRFLELMAMGHLHHQAKELLFPQDEILAEIARAYRFSRLDRELSATSNYWQTTEGHRFGIIANESEPFCRDCDRLRMDSHGHIHGCLSSNQPIALGMTEDDAVWTDKLRTALGQKQAVRFAGSALSMLEIGG